MTSKEEILATILTAIPYPHQVIDIDTDSDTDAIRFTWRGTRYCVDAGLRCEECKNGMLHGSNDAILMSGLLQVKRIGCILNTGEKHGK